jgi:hypothetical protein
LQVKPQLVPSQVAVAFAGGVHGVQAPPQEEGLELLTQAPPHMWNPTLHEAMPQLPPEHAAVPFITVQA